MSGSLDPTIGASIGGGGSPLQTPLLGRVVDPWSAMRNYNAGIASQYTAPQAQANVAQTQANTEQMRAHAGLEGAQAGLAGLNLQLTAARYNSIYGAGNTTSYQGNFSDLVNGNTGGGGSGGGGGNPGTPGTAGGPTGASLVGTVQPQPMAAPRPAIGATTPPPANGNTTPPPPAIGSGAQVANNAPPGPTGAATPSGQIGVYGTESQPADPNSVQQQPLPPPPGTGQQPPMQPPRSGYLGGQSPPGMPPVFTGSQGVINPFVGFSTPQGLAWGVVTSQEPGAEREKLFALRQRTIGQAVLETMDPRTGQANPQLWNQQIENLFNQGWITNQEVKNFYNQPGKAMQVLTSLGMPTDQNPAVQAAQEGAKKWAGVAPAAQTEANRQRIEGDNTLVHVTVPSADGTSSVDTQMTRNEAIQRGILKADGSNGTGSVIQGQAGPNAPITQGGYGVGITGQENNTGNPAARNPNSTAMGNAQFLEGTWLSEMKANRPDLAQGKTDQEILAMRDQPGLNAELAGDYARENAPKLQQAGVPVNATTLAMAHGFGPGGAQKLLNSPADASASYVLGQEVMDANPNLRGKTVADVVNGYKSRWGLGPVQFDPPGGTGETKVAGPGAGQTGASVLAGGGGGSSTTAPNPGTVAPQPGEVGRATPVPSETAKLAITSDLGQVEKDREAVADIQSSAFHASGAQSVLYDLRERLKANPGVSGAGGEFRTDLANYMKTYSPDWANTFLKNTSGFDANSAGDRQAIIKEALTAVTGAETTMLPGARYGAMLTNYFSKAFPSINTQGPAFNEMLNWGLVGQQMIKDHAGFMQADNGKEIANFQGDMTHNRYATLNASQEKWMDPDGTHNPTVYQAAADALNHRPYSTWSKNLTVDQKTEVGQIIRRVDPTQGGLLNSHNDWIPVARIPAHASW